jgi:colanic acid biosynthesis protein WcaH
MTKAKVENQSSHWLSEALFSTACAALPLVSIDVLVTRPGTHGRELLLGLRNNRPAQGWWFTPGGRIRKNEPLATAMSRVAQDEIALNPDWLSRTIMLGAWDHFYPDSAFDPDTSTHYINLPYVLHLTREEAQSVQPTFGKDLQHDAWMWMPIFDAFTDSRVHSYVKAVLNRLIESVPNCNR